jgi:multiple sugar transport system substrate-binding protein
MLLTACAGNTGGNKAGADAVTIEPMGTEDEASLRVMFWDEQSFMSQYGNLFLSKFPNVDIQVARTDSLYAYEGGGQPVKMTEYLKEQQPDVLMLDPAQYAELLEAGELVELETMINKDGYDVEGMHPAVIELIKEVSGGRLYGLAPTFNSLALYYNIDLFRRYGIEPPTDRMSWADVLQLAGRFPTTGNAEERVYGLSGDTPEKFNLIWQIGTGLGLNFADPSAKQITLNTPAWRGVFETVLGGIRAGSLYMPASYQGEMSYAEYLQGDLFVGGRSAMTLNGPWLIQKLNEAEQELKDIAPVNWAVVTVPVDPSNPDVSGSFSLGTIFAIRADSPNKSAAWEFIKYVNGDEYAKIQSRTVSGDFLTRTAHIKEHDGKSLEPFYALKPRPPAANPLNVMPAGFLGQFGMLLEEEIQAVLDDKKTLDEALAAMETRGQSALDEAYVEETQQRQEAEAGTEAGAGAVGGAEAGAGEGA